MCCSDKDTTFTIWYMIGKDITCDLSRKKQAATDEGLKLWRSQGHMQCWRTLKSLYVHSLTRVEGRWGEGNYVSLNILVCTLKQCWYNFSDYSVHLSFSAVVQPGTTGIDNKTGIFSMHFVYILLAIQNITSKETLESAQSPGDKDLCGSSFSWVT